MEFASSPPTASTKYMISSGFYFGHAVATKTATIGAAPMISYLIYLKTYNHILHVMKYLNP